MNKDRFPPLYEILKLLTSQPECNSCRLCEENVGLVYSLGIEGEKLKNQGVSISTTAEKIHYIDRLEDKERSNHWWCSCFDPLTNTCKIYEIRPLCCRLYPLDLMKLDGEVWWVLHSECPIANRFMKERKIDILSEMTKTLEQEITTELYDTWILQDSISNIEEAFSSIDKKIIKLRRYQQKSFFP